MGFPIGKFQKFPLKRNHLVMKLHMAKNFADPVLFHLLCLMVIVLVCYDFSYFVFWYFAINYKS